MRIETTQQKDVPVTKEVTLQYLANDDGLAAYVGSVAGGEVAQHPGNYIHQQVKVVDGRRLATEPRLDKEGFILKSHLTKVRDFYDDHEIAGIYEDEIKSLLKAETGAARIEVFDHTRRSASETVRLKRKLREHATVIHNDYTAESGPKRLRQLLPDEAESLLQNRFAIINVWRSINGVVHNHPLAMCDASTVAQEDLVAVVRQSKDRVGEIQLATYNPGHRWVYYPEMTENEALLFKTYDSLEQGVTRFTIHSAFDDPDADAKSPARESIETRCFVFY